MQLTNRLGAIAAYVSEGSRVIDVGTDHAYIPIYLVKNKKVVSCIATDINKGPLEKAKKNIEDYKLDNITLKLTNGLEGIPADAGDVIMISGMGGYLIIDILSRAPELVKAAKKLILQPQQDISEVRKYLHQIGFQIKDENFVKDDDKYYTVIVATHGEENYDKEYEYIYGKCLIEKKLPIFKEWLVKKDEKLKGIYKSLQNQSSEHIERRKKELEEELSVHHEVMKCLL